MESLTLTAAWKPGFASLYKANAQMVAEEIVSIGPSATPEQILDKARDPGTELHGLFEWDDTVAAERYRLDQARQVVRHLVIRETVREDKTPVRFFFNSGSSTGYQPTQIILRNQDSYQALLASAMRELNAFLIKYHSLAELDQIFEEIENLTRGKAS